MAFSFGNIQTFVRHCVEPHVIALKKLTDSFQVKLKKDIRTELDELKSQMRNELETLQHRVEIKLAEPKYPIGAIIAWPWVRNPADWKNDDGTQNWMDCKGQKLNKTLYPEYYQVDPYGTLPNLTNRFLRGDGNLAEPMLDGRPNAFQDWNIPNTWFVSGCTDDLWPYGPMIESAWGSGTAKGGGGREKAFLASLKAAYSEQHTSGIDLRPMNCTVRFLMRVK